MRQRTGAQILSKVINPQWGLVAVFSCQALAFHQLLFAVVSEFHGESFLIGGINSTPDDRVRCGVWVTFVLSQEPALTFWGSDVHLPENRPFQTHRSRLQSCRTFGYKWQVDRCI